MSAAIGTKKGATEFAGDYKVVEIDFVPVSASDVVTLSEDVHGVSEILAVIPRLTAGYDANLAGIFATFSGLAITVVTTAAAGTAATDWTAAAGKLLVIGRSGT